MKLESFGWQGTLHQRSSVLIRLRNEVEAAARRVEYTGNPEQHIELPPGVDIPHVLKGRKRMAKAEDVAKWLEEKR